MTSCEKSDNNDDSTHTVAGRLLDASNSEPIEGGTIYLDRGFTPWKTDTTSASGFYSFDIEAEHGDDLDLHAEAPRYFPNANVGSWGDYYPDGIRATSRTHVDLRREMHDIYLPPIGYVKYELAQTKPFSGGIQVRITPRNSLGVVTFNGQGLNTTYLDEKPGDAKQRIGCSIIYGGDSLHSINDSLIVPRFDTLIFRVEF